MIFVLVFVIKLFSISFYYTINSQKSQDKTAPRAVLVQVCNNIDIMKKCFFCDSINLNDGQIIKQSQNFIARFDDFAISPGHLEIYPKQHIVSFFDLKNKEVEELHELLSDIKSIIDERFQPDAYNIGINEGLEAGRTQNHFHLHLIPRYKGDVENPEGGVRNIIPNKAKYLSKMKKMNSRKDYI